MKICGSQYVCSANKLKVILVQSRTNVLYNLVVIRNISYELPQITWLSLAVLHSPIQVCLHTSTYTNTSHAAIDTSIRVLTLVHKLRKPLLILPLGRTFCDGLHCLPYTLGPWDSGHKNKSNISYCSITMPCIKWVDHFQLLLHVAGHLQLYVVGHFFRFQSCSECNYVN